MARECGFDAAGFALAEPVEAQTAARYRNWIANNHQAGMNYMAQRTEERLDPLRILPEARTVIVVLSNYYRDNPTEMLGRGKIARYAGGRDYHKVLKANLERFRLRLAEAHPGIQTWCEVDTGPVLERYWAEKAGVGWVGKNTLLINQGLGSWVFIGVILTTLELTPDSPHADHCGTCDRCLAACPTSAILEPGILDSNRCISYWTIEHRGDLPQDAELHGWIFGCDDCQTVCPWNRHAKQTSNNEFELRPGLQSPDVVKWASQTWEEWDVLTRGTALRRAGYEGMKRNCREVMGTNSVSPPPPLPRLGEGGGG